MANVAATQARQCGAEHLHKDIPWGSPPFPPRPESGEPIEELARNARTSLLFQAMQETKARCIFYGQHADDQLETSIMRLSMGSKQWGASGIRPIRRWGMGNPSDFISAGAVGMDLWVLRPLLDMPKVEKVYTREWSISTDQEGQNPRNLRSEWT